MGIGPLVWLLVFDLIVGLIWWALGKVGVAIDATLMQVMVGLVIIINVFVVLMWILGMLGWTPTGMLSGPFHGR
jgi:hypothetical protein